MDEAKYQRQALTIRSEAQKLIAEKWIGSQNCPICLESEWAVYEPQAVLPALDDSASIMVTMPLIPLTCTNCGFTHFFNAKILGITRTPGEAFDG